MLFSFLYLVAFFSLALLLFCFLKDIGLSCEDIGMETFIYLVSLLFSFLRKFKLLFCLNSSNNVLLLVFLLYGAASALMQRNVRLLLGVSLKVVFFFAMCDC